MQHAHCPIGAEAEGVVEEYRRVIYSRRLFTLLVASLPVAVRDNMTYHPSPVLVL